MKFGENSAKLWGKIGKNQQVLTKILRLESGWDSIPKRCKGVHCVDLGESFPTSIYFLVLAKIRFDTAENELISFWLILVVSSDLILTERSHPSLAASCSQPSSSQLRRGQLSGQPPRDKNACLIRDHEPWLTSRNFGKKVLRCLEISATSGGPKWQSQGASLFSSN